MRRIVALLVAVTMLGFASPVAADHDDVIVEKIPSSDADFDLELVADGFVTPLLGVGSPITNAQLYVVDQVGTITAINTDGKQQTRVPNSFTFLDVGVGGLDLLVPLGAFGPGSFDERGLLGLAFHPRYRHNGLVYTYTSEPLGPTPDFTTLDDNDPRVGNASLTVIREWRVSNPKNPASTVDPASSRVLLRIEQPQFNHNGGDIAFGPDGSLYIALGDGGGADDQGPGHAVNGNGQDLSEGNVLGKILRIDVSGSNSANGEYGIPADNPFVGEAGADEIFAYGFRNPFRISFDSRTGDLYAADVGQNDIEELNIVVSGGNYGWPVKEGTFLFDNAGAAPGFTTADSPGVPADMIDPIAQYDHDEGISITGGFVARNNSVKDLRGRYVFADFLGGRLFTVNAGGGDLAEIVPASGATGFNVAGFGQDRRGDLYVMGQASFFPVGESGQVFKLVRSSDDDGEYEFEADLAADNEVPPSGTDGSGEAELVIDPTAGTVCVEVEAEDLAGTVVAGHIHVGDAGSNGGVVVNLGVNSADYEACIDGLDPGVLATVVRNPSGHYVNIHTTAVPSGEIRGQLKRD